MVKKENQEAQGEAINLGEQRRKPLEEIGMALEAARYTGQEDASIDIHLVQALVEGLIYVGDCMQFNALYMVNAQMQAMQNMQQQQGRSGGPSIHVPR